MKNLKPSKALIAFASVFLVAAAIVVAAHSSVNACAGCGGTGGTGSVSGGYPSFNYDSIYYSVTFPSCTNPKGTLKVSYGDGNTHWIPGETTLRVGSDIVYDVGSQNYLQCYCPDGSKSGYNNVNNGVQTNYIKVSNLSEAHKGYLLRTGYKWIQNGADFGLSPEPYIYMNLPFACGQINCLAHPTTVPNLDPYRKQILFKGNTAAKVMWPW